MIRGVEGAELAGTGIRTGGQTERPPQAPRRGPSSASSRRPRASRARVTHLIPHGDDPEAPRALLDKVSLPTKEKGTSASGVSDSPHLQPQEAAATGSPDPLHRGGHRRTRRAPPARPVHLGTGIDSAAILAVATPASPSTVLAFHADNGRRPRRRAPTCDEDRVVPVRIRGADASSASALPDAALPAPGITFEDLESSNRIAADHTLKELRIPSRAEVRHPPLAPPVRERVHRRWARS